MSCCPSHDPTTPDPAWQAVLAAIAAAGRAAGSDAAAWWQQDALGGRASGDTAARARAVLTGIADGDPLMLDALPAAEPGEDKAEQAYKEEHAGPSGHPGWPALDAVARAEAVDAWREAYHTAVLDEVARCCRHALDPGDDADNRRGER
jgi:hypothetical protein